MLHKELTQRMDAFERVCTRPSEKTAEEDMEINAVEVFFSVNQKYVSCNLAALENAETNAEEYFFMTKMETFKMNEFCSFLYFPRQV